MKNIRKGNDIKIAWSIYMKDGTAFNLDGLNVSLYLTSMFSRKKLDGFVVNGNIIQWTFYGKDQKSSGKYSLELVVNDGNKGMITTDSCDFVDLVSCSCQLNGGKDEDGVETETIELESKVDVASGEVVTIEVDEALSETSVNPVQNKVITAELNKKIDGETLEKRISREHIYFYYVVIENKVYYKGYNVNEMTELQPWLLNFVVGLPITPHLLILDNDQNVNISSNKFEITTNPLGLQWQYDDLQYTLVFNNGQVITTTAIPSGGNGDANVAAIDSVGEVEDPSFDVDEKLTELSAEVEKKVDTDKVATINGQSLVNGGNITIEGGGEPSVYKVTYGVTTFAEVKEEWQKGKHLICSYNGIDYLLSVVYENQIFFAAVNGHTSYRVFVNNESEWGNQAFQLEHTANKTTSLSDKSTDTQYPSAKAVYDFVNNTLGTIINGDY